MPGPTAREPPDASRFVAAYARAEGAARDALLAAMLREAPGLGGHVADLLRARAHAPEAFDRTLAAVLAERPDTLLGWRLLAWIRAREGAFAAAKAAAAEALRLAPGHPLLQGQFHRLDCLAPGAPPAPPDGLLAAMSGLGRRWARAQRRFAETGRCDGAGLRALLRPRAAAALSAPGPHLPVLERLCAAPDVAIVGNGPSLAGSGAGEAIDAHGLVLRINFPRLEGHAADVGQRTDLMLFRHATRGAFARLLARDPRWAEVPALGVRTHWRDGTAEEADRARPTLPRAVADLVGTITYPGPTTGFLAAVLVGLLLERPVTLYGFDFFRPGAEHHYFGANRVAAAHEPAYERWFVTRFWPALGGAPRLAVWG